MEPNTTDSRIVSTMTNGVFISSIIPVTLEDNGARYRCVFFPRDGVIVYSDVVTVRVDPSSPAACKLIKGVTWSWLSLFGTEYAVY
jgi:hypothetical protein